VDGASPLREPRTCPECGTEGSVREGVCDVCLADLGEHDGGWGGAALPPATAPEPVRFGDVLAQLRAVTALASDPGDPAAVSAAGQRARSLLEALRSQFLGDLGLPDPSASAL